MNRKTLYFGIFLTSLSTLMLELSMTRLFSATMYYHFAFMAISLALFGSGASGVFIYLAGRGKGTLASGKWLGLSAGLFSLGTLLALYIILANPLTLDPGSENYYRLVKIYAGTSIPFFFAGCTITLAITQYAKEISRVYLWDLAGAAAGCLLLIPVLNLVGAINAVILVSAVSALACLLFTFAGRVGRPALASSALLAATMIGLFVFNSVTRRIDIHTAKGFEQANILFSKWNSFSRITVDGNLTGGGAQIKIDADAATGIVNDSMNLAIHQHHRNRVEALAYRLKTDADVLIIGPGGGNDVTTAQVYGMKHITAVEVNPIIARDVMSSEPFKSYSGSVYQQPNVSLFVDEGRSFIRSSAHKYDLIQATMVDTWAATAAGAFALTENNLYTVEAFKDYATHLTDDGVLTMTRWYFEPPDQLLRLISLTRVMMSELGISNPDRHIILIRDAKGHDQRTPATYLFKKSEFTTEEIGLIDQAAAQNRFEILYSPRTRPDNVFTQMIEAPDPATVWGPFVTNIEPTRDNNPFFFNSIRIANLTGALEGADELHKTNLGTFVLFALLGITSVMVVLFIVGPLLFVRRRAFKTAAKTKLCYLIYFACLGAGFITVEVAMIQKFILFLGHPVYSLTVVLFSLLIFSGLGSYLSGRFDSERLVQNLGKVILGIAVLVGIYILALAPIFYGLVQLPLPLRIVIAVVLMAPLALVMGMPMPTGIRLLAARTPEIIPWAWGLNGAASVMGSVGALSIALLTGFNQALVVGAGLYLIALFFVTRPKLDAETGIEQSVAMEKEGAEQVAPA